MTVRVPTHADGSALFWEFATDNYDVAFGLFFEWVDHDNETEISVHISDSEDEDLEDDDDEDAVTGKTEVTGVKRSIALLIWFLEQQGSEWGTTDWIFEKRHNSPIYDECQTQ